MNDMTGKRFGLLTVVRFDKKVETPGGARHYYWLCKCDCGKETTVGAANLRSGNTTSCGCVRRQSEIQRGKQRFIDLTGQKFGKLTVLGVADKQGEKHRWRCQCECGQETVVFGDNLKRGRTGSCKCQWKESVTKHGQSHSDIYSIWCGIKERCTNPANSAYHNYGGRGITIAEEWLHDFQAFADHIGPRPGPEYTCERMDNDKGYQPGNIKWATRAEQLRNKRNNVRYEYKGESLTMKEWAQRFSLPLSTLRGRLRIGWSIERALETPAQRLS